MRKIKQKKTGIRTRKQGVKVGEVPETVPPNQGYTVPDEPSAPAQETSGPQRHSQTGSFKPATYRQGNILRTDN